MAFHVRLYDSAVIQILDKQRISLERPEEAWPVMERKFSEENRQEKEARMWDKEGIVDMRGHEEF